MKVEFITPAGFGFVGKLTVKEMLIYNAWIKSKGYQFNGRNWVLPR